MDEVVQDTFVGVWRSAARFSGEGEVAAWVWGIGIRRLIDNLRKRRPAAVGHIPAPAAAEAVSAEEELLLAVEHGDLVPVGRRRVKRLR